MFGQVVGRGDDDFIALRPVHFAIQGQLDAVVFLQPDPIGAGVRDLRPVGLSDFVGVGSNTLSMSFCVVPAVPLKPRSRNVPP